MESWNEFHLFFRFEMSMIAMPDHAVVTGYEPRLTTP